MKKELPKKYQPFGIEEKIYKLWEKSGYFNPDKLPKKNKKTFTIVIPPPNITGSLHMGHALNATIQDILIRYKRMKGYKTLWLPGTDHAGIATQNVVEKQLKKEGLSRDILGKEKFIKKIWEWKKKYGNIILNQFKKIGASCDWSRTRFTMDKDYQKAVYYAFFNYFKNGLIYQDYKVVNWCPRCLTSLSDLELEYKEKKDKLYFIKYPIKKSSKKKIKLPNFIIVATTRPETMLGDAAVAVNPKDKRYKNLIGQKVILPIKNREIKIIADKRIDINFGTGAVKITPNHDLLDFEISQEHNLKGYQIINEYGKMTEEAGLYKGLKTEECRIKIVKDLKKKNLIEKIEDYTHNINKCYRCSTTIEPILSKQWFLKMTDKKSSPNKKIKQKDSLANLAIKAVKSGKIKFHPKRFEKIYFDWLKNIKDWCISRQIWWGHQIPIFYCNKTLENKNKKLKIKNKKDYIYQSTKNGHLIVANKKITFCPIHKNKITPETDVLDTWFSSALWPFATLGWPQKTKDLKKFYPTQILSTARDIINLWVARMIFSSLKFLKKIPFSNVIIHATILTKEGKRMSKSLGTGIDPMDLIKKYGADATRFGLIWQAMGNQDIHWMEEHVIAGRKFSNKIWNATRFLLQKIHSKNFPKNNIESKSFIKILTIADKKIVNQLEKTQKIVEKNLNNFKFGHALHEIYDFFWHKFCDIYIEKSKKQLEEKKLKANTQKILLYVLVNSLKLLHPFMPFITENIYEFLPLKNKKMLIIENWPKK